MSRAIRRIGPWLLWQYSICIVGLPLYFGTALLTLEKTWPTRLLVSGVILALLAAIAVFRNPLLAFIDRVALVEPDGASPRRARVLRLERHAGVFLIGCLLVIPMVLQLSRDMVESSGIAAGFLAYLVVWHLLLLLPLMLWAKNRDAERPLPPKRGTTVPGIAEMWIVPPDEDDEDGLITVAVRTEGSRSLEEVVVAVLRRQVLPPVTGGKRRWSIVVDGAVVGELTQVWTHPRWWPPIEWSASPSSQFEHSRMIFRPVGSPRSDDASAPTA